MTSEKTTRVKKELKDVGFSLPVGIVGANGALQKSFAFKKWRLKEEKELGELKKELGNATITKYISAILSTMCTKIGPHDFTTMDDSQKQLILSQMYAADIFHLYVMLRRENVSNELRINKMPCPSCRHETDFVGDLGTVATECVDDVKDLLWEYKLKEPITIRGNVTNVLTLSTVKWNVYEMLKEEHLNEAVAKEYFLINSIVGSDAMKENLVVVNDDLDELCKIDFEKLSEKIAEMTPGPEMVIETKCTHTVCKKDIFVRLQWENDSFFDISSQ